MTKTVYVDIYRALDKSGGRDAAIRKTITLVPELFEEFKLWYGTNMCDSAVDSFVKKHNIRILKEDPYVMESEDYRYVNAFYLVGYDI